MGNTRNVILPTFTSEEQLANTFSDFYITKVATIRSNINIAATHDTCKTALEADVKFDGIPLEKFSPAIHDEMRPTTHVIWTQFPPRLSGSVLIIVCR